MNKFESFKGKNVVIITGGTAGHVIPASDLAYYLDDAPIYVNEKGSKFCYAKNKIIYYMEYKSLFNTLGNILYFLIQLQPYDIVIGFGAFMCMPAMIAAKILRKKVYTHEQNMIIGKANKILTDYLGVEVLETFGVSNNEVTGMPIIQTRNKVALAEEKSQIVVLAGSGGSEFFDTVLFDIMAKWAEKNQQKVYFQTYRPSTHFMICEPFFENWFELISSSKFVIARAGANTIAQLTMLNKNALLIPLPHAVQNHQLHNAKYSGFPYIEESQIENLVPLLDELLKTNKPVQYQMNLFLIPERP